MHNPCSKVSPSWMWTFARSTAAPLYLIHAVPHTGWSESSGVDRCFPDWNHGRWIGICDYTSCGSPGGNWTHYKWFLLWRKIKLLGVSFQLKMMCLFPDKCEIKLLLKVGSWGPKFYRCLNKLTCFGGSFGGLTLCNILPREKSFTFSNSCFKDAFWIPLKVKGEE